MAEPFLGEIRIFCGNFAPVGWALCQGQLMSIAQNSALFAILGTTYGGNGTSTFGLPNLNGTVPIGAGQRQGGSTYVLGQTAGTESVSLLTSNLPAHVHPFAPLENNGNADLTDPTGAIPAVVNDGSGHTPNPYPAYTKNASTGAMGGGVTGPAGGNIPVAIMQPYLAITYIIALQGIFPSRS